MEIEESRAEGTEGDRRRTPRLDDDVVTRIVRRITRDLAVPAALILVDDPAQRRPDVAAWAGQPFLGIVAALPTGPLGEPVRLGPGTDGDLAPGVRCALGVPVWGADGAAIGAAWAIESARRWFSPAEVHHLGRLALALTPVIDLDPAIDLPDTDGADLRVPRRRRTRSVHLSRS